MITVIEDRQPTLEEAQKIVGGQCGDGTFSNGT